MNFTLHQLKVLVEVARHQSITRAAESLFLTQPAVSIQLKKLQEQFDIPLTELIGRKIYLTPFGKELVRAGESILHQAEEVRLLANAHRGLLTGNLNVAVVSTGKYVMPYFLTEFTRAHQGVNLTMDVTNRAAVLEALSRNEPDFALVSVLPDSLSVEREELLPNEIYPVASPDLTTEAVSEEALSSYPLIFRENGSATRMAMESYLNEKGILPNRQLQLTSNEAVKQAVIAGLGISLMPVIGIRNELKAGMLQVLDLPGFPITTHWNLIWLKGKELSPVAVAFLDYVRNHKEEVIRLFQ